MSGIRRFWTQASIHYRNFQVVFAAIGAGCVAAAFLALLSPGWLLAGAASIDTWLGGVTRQAGQLEVGFVRSAGTAFLVASALTLEWVRRDLRHRRTGLVPFMFLHGAAAVALIGAFIAVPGHPSLLAAGLVEMLLAVAPVGVAGLAAADIQRRPNARLVPEPAGATPLGWTHLEQRWVDAILRASLPADPSSGQPGIEGVELEEFWPSYMRRVPLHFRLGLRLTTWVVGLWPLGTGRALGTFVSLDDDGRDEVLQEIAESRFFVIRQIAFILKTTAGFAYFSEPEMREQFPAAYARRSGLDDAPDGESSRSNTGMPGPPPAGADVVADGGSPEAVEESRSE